MVPPPPPPHHLYAKANTSSSIFLHWRRPAFTTAQMINYTIRCNPVGLQNASLVLYLQTYVTSINGCFLCSPPHSHFLLYHLEPAWASAVSSCLRTCFMYTVVGDFIFTYSIWEPYFLKLNFQKWFFFVSLDSHSKIRQETININDLQSAKLSIFKEGNETIFRLHQKINLVILFARL